MRLDLQTLMPLSTTRVSEEKVGFCLPHSMVGANELEPLAPACKAYDYTTAWAYNTSEQVNAKDVGVAIENV